MPATVQDFVLEKGATFNPRVLFYQPTLTSVAISNITQAGRAVVTAEAHGLSVDWPVYIVGVVGMTEINSAPEDLARPRAAYQSRFVDSDTLQLELDTVDYTTYASGGELLFHPPVDLSDYTARMQVRRSTGSDDFLVELTTENGGLSLGGTAGTIEILIDADTTTDLAGAAGVYDLEIEDGDGKVTRLLRGRMSFSREVTR